MSSIASDSIPPLSRLLKGVDAQFVLSLPHGALYFCVLDAVKKNVLRFLPRRMDFLGDFTASTLSTMACTVVSAPQMVVTDRLMAGVYPTFPVALRSIVEKDGIKGFYSGAWPAMVQKIPSYGLVLECDDFHESISHSNRYL